MAEADIDLGLVSFRRACQALGASESKANRLIVRGELPKPLRIGAKRYYLANQLREFVAAQAAKAAVAAPATE